MQGSPVAYLGLSIGRQVRMGTWGTGYFSGDGAQDLVEELAEMPADQRHEAVERMLLAAATNPDAMWREVFPDTVIAAAALVAATLPAAQTSSTGMTSRPVRVRCSRILPRSLRSSLWTRSA